jgi:hypothetical protein
MTQCEFEADLVSHEHVSFFKEGAQKVISAAQDYLCAKNYREAAFGFYKSFLTFVDKLWNRKPMMATVWESIIRTVITESAFIEESERFLVKFLQFSVLFVPDCLKEQATISFLFSATQTQYEGTLPLLKIAVKQSRDAVYKHRNVFTFYEALFALLPILSPATRLIAVSFLKHFNEIVVPISLSNPFASHTVQLRNNGVCLRMAPSDFVRLITKIDRIGDELVPNVLKSLHEDDHWDVCQYQLAIQLFSFLFSHDPPNFDLIARVLGGSGGNVKFCASAYCAYFSIFEVPEFDFICKLLVVIDGNARGREFTKSLHFLVSSVFSTSRYASELMALNLIRFVRADFIDLVFLFTFPN